MRYCAQMAATEVVQIIAWLEAAGVWFPPNRGGFGYAASPAGTAVLVS